MNYEPNGNPLTLPPVALRMVYAVRLKEARDSRLDPYFYTPYLVKTEAAVRSLPMPVASLNSLLQFSPMNGIDARDYEEEGQRYLRVQNVRPYDLLLDDVKRVVTGKQEKMTLQQGDILLTRKGTFGVAAMVPPDAIDCLISSEIMLLRLRPDAPCSAEYLVAWLNCSAAKRLLDRHKSGAVMGHVTQEVVRDFAVPIPSP